MKKLIVVETIGAVGAFASWSRPVPQRMNTCRI
ncbi:hypothetical protein ACVWY3_004810 [Bradyrhizobium sp. USDA 4486]